MVPNASHRKKNRSTWTLPQGVSKGTWDYCESHDIADSYDRYLSDHGLFRLDKSAVEHHWQPGARTIDLGRGTGRAILPLLERKAACVAFDLSQPMLNQVREKAKGAGVERYLVCVRGNLAELDCFADDSFDLALCLFSTLGMVRTHQARAKFCQQVARILKPGGKLILQVHNYWAQLFVPGGFRWMLENVWNRVRQPETEIGDKIYPYRGIPDMYLHSFTRTELRSLMHQAGFGIHEWTPLNARQDGMLVLPKLGDYFRASGWLVVASNSGRRS